MASLPWTAACLARTVPSSSRYNVLHSLTGVERRYFSTNSLASTSKSTLTTSTHSSSSPLQPVQKSLFANGQERPRRIMKMAEKPGLHSRGIATITRQPETPEEPEVFAGSEPPSIILTDRAIEHLAKVSKKNPDLALRIAVESGGCHGYQYKMELTNEMEDDDFRFSSGESVHLYVDSTSLRLIKGSTIDYVTELIGSQFAILNNPQAKGAGCGCGVSWEPNF